MTTPEEWKALFEQILSANPNASREEIIIAASKLFSESKAMTRATIGERLANFAEAVHSSDGSVRYFMKANPGHSKRKSSGIALRTREWLASFRDRFPILDDGPFADRICNEPCISLPTDEDDMIVCDDSDHTFQRVYYEPDHRRGDPEEEFIGPICDGSRDGVVDAIGYFWCDATPSLDHSCQLETGIHLCLKGINTVAESLRIEPSDVAVYVFLHEAAHASWHSTLRLDRRHEPVFRRPKVEETLAEFVALCALDNGVFLLPDGNIIRLSNRPLVTPRSFKEILSNDHFSWYWLGAEAYRQARRGPSNRSIQSWFRSLVLATSVERRLISRPCDPRSHPTSYNELRSMRKSVVGIVRSRADPGDLIDYLTRGKSRLSLGITPAEEPANAGFLPILPCEKYRIIEHVMGDSPKVVESPSVEVCPICHKRPATTERMDTLSGKMFRCCPECAVSIMT
jgi:hypothetical protein